MILKKKILYVHLLISIFVLSISCTKDKNYQEPETPKINAKTNRTILIYMVANNSLESDAKINLRQIEEGYVEEGTNVIVFYDNADETNLFEITKEGKSIIKTYGELNSTDPKVLTSVINEVRDKYPADSYGLILWSHAYAWIPANKSLQPNKRMFGQDGSYPGMDIPELAAALPFKFDFVIIDACYMGGIEVAYELRHKTEYLLASPSSILSMGFPYHKILSKLTSPELDLVGVGTDFFQYYNILKGDFKSATISLIKTSELDALAQITDTLIPIDFNWRMVDLAKIQTFDEDRPPYMVSSIAYDMLDFFEQAFANKDLSQLIDQINKVIVYKANTSYFVGNPIWTYCGLSAYIPNNKMQSAYNEYYKQLEWYKHSGFKIMMDNL